MDKKVRHLAIIMDGNRRFANKKKLEPWKGHQYGAEKVKKLLQWCKDLEIKELTLYSLSMQNFNRPKKEFDFLMRLFVKFFSDKEMLKKVHENKIKVNFIGRTDLLPSKVQEIMHNLYQETKSYSNYVINFAMAYGGREEIVDAVNKLLKNKVEKVDEQEFSRYLYSKSEPDLIIRTGGAMRTSNFLPWQSVYSEWFFIDKFWPEFEKEDLVKVIKDFNKRERRFGK